jgi:recombination protein RecT
MSEQEHPVTALVARSRGSLEEALSGSPVTLEKFIVGLKAACGQPPSYEGAATVMDCVAENPQSVQQRLIEAAQLGLSPAPIKQHFYLIPRKIKGKLTCTSVIGYRGLIDLAIRSGQIVDIQADVVYKDDEFSIDPVTGAVENKASDPFREFDYKKLKGAFAWAQVKGRSKIITRCLSIGEIDKRRACAQTDNVWKQWPKEQVLKTAIRALLTGGFIPLGEMEDQLAAADKAESAQDEEVKVVDAADITEEIREEQFVDVTPEAPPAKEEPVEIGKVGESFEHLNDAISTAKTKKALENVYDRVVASYDAESVDLEQCAFLQEAIVTRRQELRKGAKA